MRSHHHFSYNQIKNNQYDHVGAKTTYFANFPYMIVFAVQYTYALCNIFIGPLFLNIILGQILSSFLWGVSPIVFFFIQPKIRKIITSSKNCYFTRFIFLIICSICKIAGYFFLNFNDKFKWNSFSLVFNLFVGYLLLDLSCKIIYFIFVYEQTQEQPLNGNFVQVNFSFIAHLTCYFLAFYIAFLLNQNDQYYTKSLQFTSVIACILSLPVPLFYFIKNKNKIIQAISFQLPEPNQQIFPVNFHKLSIFSQLPYQSKIQIITQFFVQCSLVTNLSYSTLWIMDNIKKLGVEQGKAFTQTILYGAFFFFFSTILYISSGYFLKNVSKYSKNFCRISLLIYGVLLIISYFQFTTKQICFIIIGAGLQLSIANYIQDQSTFGYLMGRVIVLAQFILFCVIPIILTVVNVDDVECYILISGVCCIISSVLMQMS